MLIFVSLKHVKETTAATPTTSLLLLLLPPPPTTSNGNNDIYTRMTTRASLVIITTSPHALVAMPLRARDCLRHNDIPMPAPLQGIQARRPQLIPQHFFSAPKKIPAPPLPSPLPKKKTNTLQPYPYSPQKPCSGATSSPSSIAWASSGSLSPGRRRISWKIGALARSGLGFLEGLGDPPLVLRGFHKGLGGLCFGS